MVDWFGAPYTIALQVVERYRLIDYETAKEVLERNEKESINFGRVLVTLRCASTPTTGASTCNSHSQ
jgi:hypothetical protein